MHHIFCHVYFLDCGEPLVGSTDAPRIGDSSITASSMNLIMTSIGEARLGAGENNGWIPNKRDKHPYLQFDLEKLYLICGFEVQGCGQSWVTRYRVQVSPEENFWDPWNYIKVATFLIAAAATAAIAITSSTP